MTLTHDERARSAWLAGNYELEEAHELAEAAEGLSNVYDLLDEVTLAQEDFLCAELEDLDYIIGEMHGNNRAKDRLIELAKSLRAAVTAHLQDADHSREQLDKARDALGGPL